MNTPLGSRPRVRATASKERLFEAAMQLLGSRAPEAVSVDEIAAAAGVSKGTVYYNFGSKDGLVSQILTFGAQKLLGELTDAASGPDPYLNMKAMLEFAMDFVATYPSFAQLWLKEQLRNEDPDEARFSPLHTQVTDLIISVLEDIVQMDEAEKLAVATSIFGAALFTARMRAAGRSRLDRDLTVRAVLHTVDGLIATHPAASA